MTLTPREARNAYARACRHGTPDERDDAKRQLAVAVIASTITDRLADCLLTPTEGDQLRGIITKHTMAGEPLFDLEGN